MRARNANRYSNGASVHYGGTNDMLPHWASRTHLYKPSIVFADDFAASSTFTTSALQANAGMLGRQFSISYQGINMSTWYNSPYACTHGQVPSLKASMSRAQMLAFARWIIVYVCAYYHTKYYTCVHVL